MGNNTLQLERYSGAEYLIREILNLISQGKLEEVYKIIESQHISTAEVRAKILLYLIKILPENVLNQLIQNLEKPPILEILENINGELEPIPFELNNEVLHQVLRELKQKGVAFQETYSGKPKPPENGNGHNEREQNLSVYIDGSVFKYLASLLFYQIILFIKKNGLKNWKNEFITSLTEQTDNTTQNNSYNTCVLATLLSFMLLGRVYGEQGYTGLKDYPKGENVNNFFNMDLLDFLSIFEGWILTLNNGIDSRDIVATLININKDLNEVAGMSRCNTPSEKPTYATESIPPGIYLPIMKNFKDIYEKYIAPLNKIDFSDPSKIQNSEQNAANYWGIDPKDEKKAKRTLKVLRKYLMLSKLPRSLPGKLITLVGGTEENPEMNPKALMMLKLIMYLQNNNIYKVSELGRAVANNPDILQKHFGDYEVDSGMHMAVYGSNINNSGIPSFIIHAVVQSSEGLIIRTLQAMSALQLTTNNDDCIYMILPIPTGADLNMGPGMETYGSRSMVNIYMIPIHNLQQIVSDQIDQIEKSDHDLYELMRVHLPELGITISDTEPVLEP